MRKNKMIKKLCCATLCFLSLCSYASNNNYHAQPNNLNNISVYQWWINMGVLERYNAIKGIVQNPHESATLNGCITNMAVQYYGNNFDTSKTKKIRDFYCKCVKKYQGQQPTKKNVHLKFKNNTVVTIVSDKKLYQIKRSVVVRLHKRVSKKILRTIALKIKKSDQHQYIRTFITYYLPDMKIGNGAYATTNFNPDLSINILGISPKQMHAYKTNNDIPSTRFFGPWIDEASGGKITIFFFKGTWHINELFKDNSLFKREMVAQKTSEGLKFTQKGTNSFGEYYLVTKAGDLKLMDADGYIRTAKQMTN